MKESYVVEIKDFENIVIMELKDGVVVIELLLDVVLQYVVCMKELVCVGKYDNVVFYCVIDGFMVQIGDVEYGNMENDFNLCCVGIGGLDLLDLLVEFLCLLYDCGIFGVVCLVNLNLVNSQFFINFNDNYFLNGQYIVYGCVIEGMEYVDVIVCGELFVIFDCMISVKVVVDVDV